MQDAPTQTPCSCKPPAPPAQLAALRHGQVAPTPGKCPGKKGMGSRGSPRPSTTQSQAPQALAPPTLTPGLCVMDSSVLLGEELGLGPQCPRECQQPRGTADASKASGLHSRGVGGQRDGGSVVREVLGLQLVLERRGESRVKGLCQDFAGQVRGKKQPRVSQQWGLGVEGQGMHSGCPK